MEAKCDWRRREVLETLHLSRLHLNRNDLWLVSDVSSLFVHFGSYRSFTIGCEVDVFGGEENVQLLLPGIDPNAMLRGFLGVYGCCASNEQRSMLLIIIPVLKIIQRGVAVHERGLAWDGPQRRRSLFVRVEAVAMSSAV